MYVFEACYLDFKVHETLSMCLCSGMIYSVHLYSISDSKPTIQELQALHHNKGALRIIESTAADWETLAISLGFDMPVIHTIRRATHYQPEDACREMLARWLEGEGASWNNLLQALEAINEQTLASDLRDVLQ